MRDPVMTMMGVTPGIASQMVAHVDEFLGNDDFHRTRPLLIDSLEVDEHQVVARAPPEAVRAAVGRRHGSADPRAVGDTARRDQKMVERKIEQVTVVANEVDQAGIALVERH